MNRHGCWFVVQNDQQVPRDWNHHDRAHTAIDPQSVRRDRRDARARHPGRLLGRVVFGVESDGRRSHHVCCRSAVSAVGALRRRHEAARRQADTLGISVDGGEVVAYACNGTDDEAWFFGNRTDGTIGLKSKFRDALNARFDGTDVDGDVTMNGVTYAFTAAPVSGEAGIYTADRDGVRATWVVRDDGSAIGVQLNGISGTLDQADIIQLNDAQFRAEVRNKRQLQQAQQISRLSNGTMRSTINGSDVTPTRVTGSFRLN